MANLAGFRISSVLVRVPGLALALSIAGVAMLISSHAALPGLSPLILAIVLGIVIGHVWDVPPVAAPGLAFSQRMVLRGAIVLLGLQITVNQVLQLGLDGVLILVTLVGATFLFTIGLGRLLGIDRKLVQLIAVGTAICGASAIAATNSVTRDSEESVAYSIACITLFGTLSLLAYPAVAALAGLSPEAYGFWVGASLHEVGQVLAAADPTDPQNDVALLAKLARVLLLIPMVLALGYFAAREDRRAGKDGKIPVPWFIVGFAVMSLIATADVIPADLKASLNLMSQIMLATALAAMGLAADMRELATRGIRPVVLGGISTIFIAMFGLTLAVWAFGH